MIKLQTFRHVSLLKKGRLRYRCEYCEIFKNTYLEEHLRTSSEVPFIFIPRFQNDVHFFFSLFSNAYWSVWARILIFQCNFCLKVWRATRRRQLGLSREKSNKLPRKSHLTNFPYKSLPMVQSWVCTKNFVNNFFCV